MEKEMSKIPLVRRAIVGAALAHGATPSQANPLVLEQVQENQWTPAALERAGSTLKALNRMAKRPPVNLLFEDITYTPLLCGEKTAQWEEIAQWQRASSSNRKLADSICKTGRNLHCTHVDGLNSIMLNTKNMRGYAKTRGGLQSALILLDTNTAPRGSAF
ncbi:hypothetical protein EVAR_67038_1 [Eumeta japonica]|uniref:Uncharacterized protein n=1 Tax=Eumeta variegata TaxID=151549 RepID=A0A4C1ZSL3_EUMVA|nr:hypothetical protein EVAR_67038_1 [Eumeta japonica]